MCLISAISAFIFVDFSLLPSSILPLDLSISWLFPLSGKFCIYFFFLFFSSHDFRVCEDIDKDQNVDQGDEESGEDGAPSIITPRGEGT